MTTPEPPATELPSSWSCGKCRSAGKTHCDCPQAERAPSAQAHNPLRGDVVIRDTSRAEESVMDKGPLDTTQIRGASVLPYAAEPAPSREEILEALRDATTWPSDDNKNLAWLAARIEAGLLDDAASWRAKQETATEDLAAARLAGWQQGFLEGSLPDAEEK